MPMIREDRRAVIPQHVYSRSAGERVAVLNVVNLRVTVLDEIASQIWKVLESQPAGGCSLREIIAAYAPQGGAAAELASERVRQLAQANWLELKE